MRVGIPTGLLVSIAAVAAVAAVAASIAAMAVSPLVWVVPTVETMVWVVPIAEGWAGGWAVSPSSLWVYSTPIPIHHLSQAFRSSVEEFPLMMMMMLLV